MRVKRQREVRRHVRFYRTCCGFREPFKVICDGTFLHHVTTVRVSPLATSLPKLLGFPTRVHVTRCILAELQRLGAGFEDTRLAARKMEMIRCEHDAGLSASECIERMVADGNPHHFFVASQDVELKRKMKKMPHAAIISANGTSISLEAPSKLDLSEAQKAETARLGLSEHEEKLLLQARMERKRKRLEASRKGLKPTAVDEQIGATTGEKKAAIDEEGGGNRLVNVAGVGKGDDEEILEGQEGGDMVEEERNVEGMSLWDDDDDEEAKKPPWKRLGYKKDVAKFKRKRVKGPNPLSCKKKTKPSLVKSESTPFVSKQEDEKRHKRPRRKKNKSGDSAEEVGA